MLFLQFLNEIIFNGYYDGDYIEKSYSSKLQVEENHHLLVFFFLFGSPNKS